MVFRFINSLTRNLIRRPLYFAKRNAKTLLMTYATAVLPAGYTLTSLTTQVPLSEPAKVVEVMKNSGITNIISGGTLMPVVNGAKSLTGQVFTAIGNTTDSQELMQAGANLKATADSWFNQGQALVGQSQEIVNNSKNKIEEIKSIVALTDPNKPEESAQAQVPGNEWSFEAYPDYYRVLGVAELDISQFPEQGQIANSVDELNRTSTARGTLTHTNVMNSKKKPPQDYNGAPLDTSFKGKADNPTGYPAKNPKIAIPWLYGKTYSGYAWNRSHVIADSLGGSATANNAVTGTRTQNVGGTNHKGGMRYAEIKVHDYLKDNKDGIVYYQVDQVYHENEMIPRSTIVNFKSADGTLDERVEVFNTANGWSIDYNTAKVTPNR